MSVNHYQPSPLADVRHIEDGNRCTLVFPRAFRHAPEKIWEMLTAPDCQRQWAPFEADRNLSAAGSAKLMMIDRDVEMKFDAQVTQATMPVLLEYFWGTDLLNWQLEKTSDGTLLTLRHATGSRDWIPKVAAGWHICLDVAERFLEAQPVGRIVGEDAKRHGWTALHDQYAAALHIKGSGWPDGSDGPQ